MVCRARGWSRWEVWLVSLTTGRFAVVWVLSLHSMACEVVVAGFCQDALGLASLHVLLETGFVTALASVAAMETVSAVKIRSSDHEVKSVVVEAQAAVVSSALAH